MENMERILLTAIAIERHGQEYYNCLSKGIIDDEGRALIVGLAHDEKEHEEILIKQFERLIRRPVPSETPLESDSSLKAIDEIFDNNENEALEKQDLFAALEIGISTEQKSIDFYSSERASTTDRDLRKLFGDLIDIEKGHKSLLEQNLFHLKQGGSWWGYVPILEG